MAAKTKFFRVAVEGATTDGRKIDPDWLKQMAATYNREKYGARIFCEHIRGLAPDGPFNALGDVLALKTEEIADGPFKGKLGLYAQIDPTEDMVTLIKSRKKIYSSMEIDRDFADSGMAYLIGLGVTDGPASLGTEILTFASQHPDANPFNARKQRPENLFSAGMETVIELEPEADPAKQNDPSGLFAKILNKLESLGKPEQVKPKVTEPEPTEFSAAIDALTGVTTDLVEVGRTTAAGIDSLRTEFAALKTDHESRLLKLSKQMDETPALGTTTRPVGTGNNTPHVTDC